MPRGGAPLNKRDAEHARLIVCVLLGFSLVLAFNPPSLVQAAAPITPSGLNTQVNLSQAPPPGKVQYDITGGTRPGGGMNLFHSFGNFNVPTNNIANFLKDSGLTPSNILGRVSGGNASNIFGTIQTNGVGRFCNANSFLKNPAGVTFPSRICLSEMRAFYLHLGERFHSSFSRLTPGEDPYSNAAIHGRPTHGAAAKLGG